ncbi:MAG: hypothetical protein WCF19_04275, partial [Chlamydiales bacterium]
MITKIIVLISAILSLSHFISQSKSLQIPLEFSSGLPLIKVEIEGKFYSLILDLGSPCEFALRQDVLNNLKKERIDVHTILGLDAQEITSSTYLLQRIRLHNGEIIHTLAQEESRMLENHISGIIGRNILQTCNLILDFHHSVLVILKETQDLQCGVPEIPFEMTRWGAVFSIETDFGIKRFSLNTSAPLSGIRSEKNGKISTSKFKIGAFDLGPTDLEVIDIHPNVNDIDGYLGSDFFMKHVVRLDFQKGRASI